MMRRVVRGLPPIKWRDQKIDSWREQARENKERAREAERALKELQEKTARASSAAAPAAPVAEPTPAPEPAKPAPKSGDGARVVQDDHGVMPRADLTPTQVKVLKDAGHVPTVGAAESDPRAYPSFVTELFAARRIRQRLSDQCLKDHPRREIPKKLQNFALAATHGVQPPTIHAIWRTAEEIDLSQLPETFVIKSNGGAGSRGVYPLRRVAGETDTFEITDETRRRITGAEVIRNLTTDAKLTGPWFAEELLVPDVGESALPSDIKIYAFYGQVGYGFARRAPLHRGSQGWQQKLEFQYFDGEGKDIEMRGEPSRRDIPVTPHLPEMLEHARVLSKAVPLPFVRVDLYGTTKGIVMGEITLLPGGNQHYIPVQDARLGKMWEEAEMRLQIDLARNGRPYAILPGEHPIPEILEPYAPEIMRGR